MISCPNTSFILFTRLHGDGIFLSSNVSPDPGCPQGSRDGGAGLDRVRDEVRRRCPIHSTVSPHTLSAPTHPGNFVIVTRQCPLVGKLVCCRHGRTCSASLNDLGGTLAGFFRKTSLRVGLVDLSEGAAL